MRAAAKVRARSGARKGGLPLVPLVAAAAYALALALPALSAPGAPGYSGLDLLLEGWRGARAGVFAWFANPLFVAALGLALGGLRRSAGVAAGIGCVLALTSFAATPLARRGGAAIPEIDYAAGFYVWLAAQLCLLVWCWAAAARPA